MSPEVAAIGWWLVHNIQIVLEVIGFFSIIAANTKMPEDDIFWEKVYWVVELFAFNFGGAESKETVVRKGFVEGIKAIVGKISSERK